MSTITFDTLKFAERLEKAGMTREQAAAMAEAQKEVFAEALETQLATKSDVVRLESRMERMELKFDSKFTLLQWMLTGLIGIAIANFAKQFF